MKYLMLTLCLICSVFVSTAQAVTIDMVTVPIGNPGNANDLNGVGGVGTSQAPTLIGVGAASANFFLTTGRMPAASPDGTQAIRKQPAYSPAEIDALAGPAFLVEVRRAQDAQSERSEAHALRRVRLAERLVRVDEQDLAHLAAEQTYVIDPLKCYSRPTPSASATRLM